MDYRSLFRTTVRILRQNKLIWLFSLAYPLIYLLALLPKNLAVLSCCLLFIWLFLYIAGQLGVLLTLYHGCTSQAVNFLDLCKEIKSYFFRSAGIFFLYTIIFIIPYILFFTTVRRLPYIFVMAITEISVIFLVTFLIDYILLGMIRNKLDIKGTTQLWANHWNAKLMIAISCAFIFILFNLLLVVFQKGLSMSVLGISYQDVSAINNLPVPRIALGLFLWIIHTITSAVVVSFYFMNIEAKEGVPQNVPQLG